MKKAGFSALEKPAFHLCVRVVLEVVNQAKVKVAGLEVKAKALFAVNGWDCVFNEVVKVTNSSYFYIIVVTIAQEAHRSDEVNLLAQANLHARLDANLPLVE